MEFFAFKTCRRHVFQGNAWLANPDALKRNSADETASLQEQPIRRLASAISSNSVVVNPFFQGEDSGGEGPGLGFLQIFPVDFHLGVNIVNIA